MEFKDYYQLLGVTKDASADEIRKAFRKLARQHHPDVNPGDAAAEAKFKELNEAHEVLSDPVKRQKYDRLGANWKQYEHAQPAGAPFGREGPFAGRWPGGGVRWEVHTKGRPGGGTVSDADVRDLFGDGSFSDFFHTFFGGGGAAPEGGSSPRRRRGRDLESAVELSLDEAFHGVSRRISIHPPSAGAPRTVDVKIPAGVIDGSRVRIAGRGEPGAAGAASGDLYLRVRLRTHPEFEARGHNLYVKAALPVTTAVLGGEVEVPTLDGRPVRLKVPAGTQSGQIFRLKGKGMPGLGRRTRGDLFATMQVTIPKRLGEKARAHYEALAALENSTTSHSKVEP